MHKAENSAKSTTKTNQPRQCTTGRRTKAACQSFSSIRLTLITASVIAVLSGCASRRVWVKPEATQQDFVSDSYSCEKDVRQSGYYGTGLIGAVNAEAFYSRCMNAHGWYLERH